MSGGAIDMILTEDRRIVMVSRRYRSKWWRVKCFCPRSRRRKDGTCKHEREVFSLLRPEIKQRAHIDAEGV